MSGVRVLGESVPGLGIVQVHIVKNSTSDIQWPPCIRFAGTCLEVNQTKLDLQELLPGASAMLQPSATASKDAVSLRFQVPGSVPGRFLDVNALSNRFPWSAELQARRLLPLRCRDCQAVVVSLNDLKCLPLPSSHWLELSELWICHPNDSDTQYGVKFESLEAKEGMILVGKEFLLIDKGLSVCSDLVESSEHGLTCSKCQNVLGVSSEENQGFRLAKYAVMSPALTPYTLENCVAEMIFDFASCSNCYHVFISPLDALQRDHSLCLTIINAKVEVCFDSSWRLQPAIKVLYTRKHLESARNWAANKHARLISLDRRRVKELFTVLSDWNLLIPKDFSEIKGMKVAYLKR
jgi:hypothetical protein